MKRNKIIIISLIMLLTIITSFGAITLLTNEEETIIEYNSNVLTTFNCSDMQITFRPDNDNDEPMWYNVLDGRSYFKYSVTFPHSNQLIGIDWWDLKYYEPTVEKPLKQSKWIDVKRKVEPEISKVITMICQVQKDNLLSQYEYLAE